MNTIEEIEEKTQLFASEFPKFYHFLNKEIEILKFGADLALSVRDEESAKSLNDEAHELSQTLSVLTKRYTMDLFE
ncbi:hypothetical protein [Tenacibaculum sp. M341]|uniref:hypothetical protein n=1 Tax=Tenacibaculum sp. M341 TaxID=2530339 RepID=UPI0010464894|nr:hypothetical protein [Tenacibaculum sp. M341]TCI93597.1 hypothetical protein EYW44_04085 [Tenacibaculum sp. M341]